MTTEITEILEKKVHIDSLIDDNQSMLQRIAFNEAEIQKMIEEICCLEKEKYQDTFTYSPLLDGKIDGTQINSITVHGCKCLTKNGQCDAKHNISIYGVNSRKRLNFNNERMFTMKELVELNYIDKLEITVDDAWQSCLVKNCWLARNYPDKIVVLEAGFD